MSGVPTFDDYLETLGRLTAHVDPTAVTPESEEIRAATRQLQDLLDIESESVADWAAAHPHAVPVLGLTVGVGQEKLKNSLRKEFGTSGWVTLARQRPADLVDWLDREYDLLRLLRVQLERSYDFEDVLVARAGTRVIATSAGRSGRDVEDEIEAIADGLGLPYATRTRFTGRHLRTAPCDLAVPGGADAQIVIAAKGFDSTGSKLTDAVREIEEMADVRLPSQYVFAVVDGIGWLSRKSDLRRIHGLWESGQINGLYTLASLGQLRDDLEDAARLLRIARRAV